MVSETSNNLGWLKSLIGALRPYRNYLFWCALAVVTLLAYRPVWDGTPLMDDDAYLIAKPELRSVSGLVKIWTEPQTSPQGHLRQYHPLVNTVFWLADKGWGDAMTGYHLLNLFLHLTAALLFWKILRQLAIPGAWLAAAIFVLHPVQVDSVAWIAEIKNTLSAVFFFACIAAYLKFTETKAPKFYALSLILFLVGLLAKGTVGMAAIVLPILFWWKQGELNWKRDLRPLLPFVCAGVVSGIATVWMERKFGGAEGAAFAFSFLDRVLIAGRAFWFYLGKAVWPTNLLFVYPRWTTDPHVWSQYLFPVAVLVLFAGAWSLRNECRWFLTSFLIFTALLFPFLGFFNLVFFRLSFVSDHFQYFAILGLIVPLAAGAEVCLTGLRGTKRMVGYGLVIAIVAVLAILTAQHSPAYHDYRTCWNTVVKQNPDHWMSQVFQASAALREEDLNGALVHWRTALKNSPASPAIQSELVRSIGDVYSKQGLGDQAISEFERALTMFPDFPEAHHDLANALRRKGLYHDAVTHYEKALRLEPDSLLTLNNLGWLLATCPDASVRDGSRAVEVARKAERLTRQGDPMILHTLAAAYAEHGEFDRAIETVEQALELAEQQRQEPLIRAIPYELSLYRDGQPFHEPAH